MDDHTAQVATDMSADNLEEYIFDLYFERAFKKHPLSRPILGTEQSLNKKAESLKDWTMSLRSGPISQISAPNFVRNLSSDHSEVLERELDRVSDNFLGEFFLSSHFWVCFL